MNRVARLAFREHHQPRTTLFWQELVWTDSTDHCPNHRCNQHNDGLWVEKGKAVPPLQNFDFWIITVTATPQSHDMV